MESRKMRRLRRLLPQDLVDFDTGDTQSFREFDSEFEARSRPCLVRGGMKSWPALRKWCPPWTHLNRVLGPTSVIDVAALPPGGRLSGISGKQQYVSMSFTDFLHFDAQCPILAEKMTAEQMTLLPLLADVELPAVVAEKSGVEANLWMNLAAVVSEAHYDSYNGVLCVVHGSKKVRLWSPSISISATPLFSETYNALVPYSPLPPPTYSVTVRKGQGLFIPEGWWHEVRSAQNTTAVSFWWKGMDQGRLKESAEERLDAYLCRATLRRLVEKQVRENIDRIAAKNTLRYPSSSPEEVTAVESGDSELIVEILRSQTFESQLSILASVSTDTLKNMLLRIQNDDLEGFIMGLEPLSAFLILDKLGRDDAEEDNSMFYKELWSRESDSERLVSHLLSLKQHVGESTASQVLSTFFAS